MTAQPELSPPILITCANARAVLGVSWNMCIAAARAHNVPVIEVSKKILAIRTDLLLEAFGAQRVPESRLDAILRNARRRSP
jgi:hypothetical protein